MTRKKDACIGASITIPAIHDDFFMLWDFMQPKPQFLDRNKMGPGNGQYGILCLRSYIKEEKVFAYPHFFMQLIGIGIYALSSSVEHFLLLFYRTGTTDIAEVESSRDTIPYKKQSSLALTSTISIDVPKHNPLFL